MLEEAGKQLISQGGAWAALWVFSVFALGSAVIYLQKKLNTCQADLVAAVKAFGEIVTANTVVMTQNTQENAKHTAAREAGNRALEHLTSQVTIRMDGFSKQIDEGLREVRETRAIVSDGGRVGRRA